MLLKWLFLLILTWYIYRAAGKIIDAVLGKREPPAHIRRPDSSIRPTAPPGRTDTTTERRSTANEHKDIEDARWKDV